MPELSAVLDAEFLFLLSLLRPVYARLTDTNDRERARLWLQRLCWVPSPGQAARRDRNAYLAELLVAMQKNELGDVFREDPPQGPLVRACVRFPPPEPLTWLNTVPGFRGDMGSGDLDGRTYVSTQELPDGRGAFGYLAVSMGDGEPQWIQPGAGESPGFLREDPGASSTPTGPLASASVERILESRPPKEKRDQLLQLFDSLLEQLDQAERNPGMLSPELDRLLLSFQPPAPPGSPAEQDDLLRLLRARLLDRRERIYRRSEALDELTSRLSDQHLGDERDEDDVGNVRPENVALLEGAYPRPLVQRFLDAIVRERVTALGRARARQYYINQVQVGGRAKEVAEDIERYRTVMAGWATQLREAASEPGTSCLAELKEAVEAVGKEARRSAGLAGQVCQALRQLSQLQEAGQSRVRQARDEQEGLRAEIELLRAKRAAQRRRIMAMRRKTVL